MAISFKVENVPISAVRDRAMFNTFANNQSYVIKDIGSELEVLSSAQSFIVQLGTGEAVICGGSMLSEGDENRITLGENESGYLVVRIDLAQTGTNVCRFMNVPSLIQGNINNGSDLIYDLPLYVYATDSSGVQNLNDIRTIKDSASIAETTYDPLSVNAQSGIAVKQAIDALDVTTSGAGTNKTLTALSQTDGKISATFNNISITKSQVSDFPTSMTPTSHTHGNITNDGKLGSDVTKASGDKFVLTDSSDSNKIIRSNISLGTSTTTFLNNAGNWATPAGNFKGINQGSTLVNTTWGSNTTYTWSATGDGWLVIKAENNTVDYYINNVKIGGVGNYEYSQPIPIKSGQSIKAINSDNRVTNNRFTVYAVN